MDECYRSDPCAVKLARLPEGAKMNVSLRRTVAADGTTTVTTTASCTIPPDAAAFLKFRDTENKARAARPHTLLLDPTATSAAVESSESEVRSKSKPKSHSRSRRRDAEKNHDEATATATVAEEPDGKKHHRRRGRDKEPKARGTATQRITRSMRRCRANNKKRCKNGDEGSNDKKGTGGGRTRETDPDVSATASWPTPVDADVLTAQKFVRADVVDAGCDEAGGDLECRLRIAVYRASQNERVINAVIRTRQTEVLAIADSSREILCLTAPESTLALPPPPPPPASVVSATESSAIESRGPESGAITTTTATATTPSRPNWLMAWAAQNLILRGAQTGTTIAAKHTCDDNCAYEPAIRVIGVTGCGSVARVLESAYRNTATFTAEDVWSCQVSGRPHVCTYEHCDSKYPENDGRIVCTKTGKEYGRSAVPEARAYSGWGAHPSAAVVRVHDDAVIMHQARAVAPDHEWRAPRRSGAANASSGRHSRPAKKRQRSSRSKARDVVEGRSCEVARLVLLRRCEANARAAAAADTTTATTTTTVADNPTSLVRLLGPTDVVDAQGSAATSLAEAARSDRATVIGGLFSRWVPGPVTEPPDLAASYRQAVEMCAAAVVSLPERVNGAAHISAELAAVYVDRYSKLVWNGWTLTSWYASALSPQTRAGSGVAAGAIPAIANHAATETPSAEAIRFRMTDTDGKRVFDVSTKLRQLAFGLLYQAKYGFHAKVDLRTALGFAQNEAKIAAAIAAATTGAEPTATTIDDFSKAHAITFLRRDKYLESRLVAENRISTRGPTVDGLRVDGTLVNEGTNIIKTCLSGIAAWSTAVLVADIAAGVEPRKAIADFEQRSALAYLGPD